MTDSRPVHTTSTPAREEDSDLFEGPRVTSNNIPIIEVQRGQAPAPNPASAHKLVDFKHLQMLLLGDKEGTILYRCSNFLDGVSGERCWKEFENPRSAVSHISTHGQVRTPDYSEETLRLLIRLVKTFDAAGHANYAALTAQELNRQGVKTVNNQPWNGRQVSNLYLTHRDKYRVHVRTEMVRRLASAAATPTTVVTDVIKQEPIVSESNQLTPVPTPPVSKDVSLADLDRLSAQLLKDTDNLFDLVKDHANKVMGFVEVVGTKLAEAAAKPDVDPEMLDKAQRWDEMRRIMSGM